MFCKRCGAQLQDGASFCGQCGASQGAPQSAAAPVPDGAQYDRNANPFAANPATAAAAYGELPSDYLLQNILAALFCCQIVGVIGIVFSAMAKTAKNSNNMSGYASNAHNAKMCFWIALISGVLVYAGWFTFAGISAVAELNESQANVEKTEEGGNSATEPFGTDSEVKPEPEPDFDVDFDDEESDAKTI